MGELPGRREFKSGFANGRHGIGDFASGFAADVQAKKAEAS